LKTRLALGLFILEDGPKGREGLLCP
jgi:hypothetical protein